MNVIEKIASQQNNIVQLLADVRLTAERKDALYFTSNDERDGYFDTKSIYTYTDCSYIRDKRALKVPANDENMRELSYMRFRNMDYSGPWIYCFVQNVEYINPHTSAITFQLDAWTTYQNFVDIKQCDVTREHTSSSAAYNANTVPEGIETGDYILAGVNKITLDTDTFIIISSVSLVKDPGTIDDIKINGSGGDVYQNIPSAASVYVVNAARTDDIASIMTYLEEYPWVSGNILSISIFPSQLLPPYQVVRSEIGFDIGVLSSGAPVSLTQVITNNWKSVIGGRSAGKLYCYPYCMIEIVMPDGNSCMIKPELLEGDLLSLYMQGVCVPSSVIIAQVLRYGARAGVPQDALYGSVVFNGFPTFPIQNNSYVVAKAQQESQYELSNKQTRQSNWIGGAFDVIRGIAGGLTGEIEAPISSAMSLINRYVDYQNRAEQQRLNSGQMQGSIAMSGGWASGAQTLLYAYDKFTVTVRFWTIKPEYVNRITQYFDMYGYKVNEIKIPNISLRSRYNYVKCSSVNIFGDIPQEYLNEIRSMFLSGCTFWRDWNNVGVYGNNPNWG